MAKNPIEKALATADAVQGAQRAMERLTDERVKVYGRTELADDARRNVEGYAPAEADRYIDDVVHLFERATQRGDGIAVYENSDLGHSELGERQYVSYGSSAAQLETRDGAWATGQCFSHGDDVLPRTLPDIGGRINWRYQLVAIAPAVMDYAQNETVTGRTSTGREG